MAQGTRIPVISVERLRFESGGRGIVIDDDAANFDVGTWSGKWAGSGGGFNSGQFLPAASASAWWKVKDDTGNSYYIPLFNTKW